MAHIHQARNDLKAKLDRSRQSGTSRQPLWGMLGTILAAALLLASVIAILYLITHTEVALSFRESAPVYILNALKALWARIEDLSEQYGIIQFLALAVIGGFLLMIGHVSDDLWEFLFILGFFALVGILAYEALFSIAHISLYAVPFLIGAASLLHILGRHFGIALPVRESEETQILQAGFEGEQEALKLMKKLGNDCHVYTNLRIPYNGGESETDFIVVSPAGVSIVEVKNHVGDIQGDASDDMLRKIKTVRGGIDEKTFYNPIKQVSTHAHRLAGFLRSQGIHTYVRTCVLFVNKDATLSITDRQSILRDKCPVFSRQTIQQLYDYVSKGKTVLNAASLQRTVTALNHLLEEGLH